MKKTTLLTLALAVFGFAGTATADYATQAWLSQLNNGLPLNEYSASFPRQTIVDIAVDLIPDDFSMTVPTLGTLNKQGTLDLLNGKNTLANLVPYQVQFYGLFLT